MTREEENRLKFLAVHIKNNGVIAARCLNRAGEHLKQLREQKAYNETHGSFEEYIEDVIGIDAKLAKTLIRACELCGEMLEKHKGAGWRAYFDVLMSLYGDEDGGDGRVRDL